MYSQPVMVNGGFAAAIADLVGRETSSCTFTSFCQFSHRIGSSENLAAALCVPLSFN